MLMNLLPVARTNKGLQLNDLLWNKENQCNEAKRRSEFVNILGNRIEAKKLLIRKSLANYIISDEPLYMNTYYEEITSDSKMQNNDRSFCDSGYNTQSQTDIEIDFEESRMDQNYETDVVDTLINESNYVEDFEPQEKDDMNLEYTFRLAALVENAYAGPSHWKFLKINRQRKDIRNKTRRILTKRTNFNEFRQFEAKETYHLIRGDFKIKPRRKRTMHITLPNDYEVKTSLFNGFENCRLGINDPVSEIYGSELGDETAYEENVDQQDSSMPAEENCNISLKADTKHFTKRPEKFNMRKIRSLSLSIVEVETLKKSEVKFSEIHRKMHEMFKYTSCALAFFGVLAEACDEKISIAQGKSIDDFTVKLL